MVPLRIFIGVDKRQPVAWTAAQFSIWTTASVPVTLTPMVIDQLPIERRGLTEFTYTRYLVPWLCGYDQRPALFLDADMLVVSDIAELFSLWNPQYAVQVVKGGQRFEWPSLMLFNPSRCARLTPQWIENEANVPQEFQWGPVGELPPEWNHCVGYDEPREDAKLLHYTQGVPVFPETENCEHAIEWRQACYASMQSVSWQELMGRSVHAPRVIENASPPGMR